jgi:hypothetical protein
MKSDYKWKTAAVMGATNFVVILVEEIVIKLLERVL